MRASHRFPICSPTHPPTYHTTTAGPSLAPVQEEAVAQPRIDGAGAVLHLPAIAAVPIPAVPGSSGSRIATTSNPADQEAFMQKADAVFKLTAPKETALDVKKPPTELAPKPIKPRQRRSATATATKGIRTVPTSDSFSSPSLLQHGGSSGLTSAAAGEDDFSLGEWEGDELVDELVEEDVIAAAMEEELAGGDEILAAMQELAGGDEVTAAMQEVAGGDEITAAM